MKKVGVIILLLISLSLSGITLYDAFLLEVSQTPIGDDIIDVNPPLDEPSDEEPIEEPILYEVISNATMYQDQDMTITLEKIRKFNSDVYVVHVHIRNMQVMQSLFAKDTFGKNISEATSSMAKRAGAVLAINGDFHGYRFKGLIIRNGRLYLDTPRSAPDNTVMLMHRDGPLSSIIEGSIPGADVLASGVLHSFSFGPVLVNDGAITSLESNFARRKNPRTAIGLIEPHHYVIVVADGRTDQSPGLSMQELAQTFVDLGATFAYNLDGGGSSALWFQNKIVNRPTFDGTRFGERAVSDALGFIPVTP